MAYASDVSGRNEIYVQPFPSGERRWKNSLAGGQMPRWRGDGRELFFVAAAGPMTAVPVRGTAGAKPSFELGAPQPLFEAHVAYSGFGFALQYDVTSDGKQFLITTTGDAEGKPSPPLNVVVNWNAGLKK
jgi:hypothetical protein